jgi:FkbM family methyltransferase
MFQTIKSRLRKTLMMMSGRYSHLSKDVSISTRWFGNNYGGFYACSEFVKPSSVVYSFGIGEDISFDEAIIQATGCSVFGFDPTPKSIEWVKTNKGHIDRFKFYPFGIAIKSGLVDFFLPIKDDHVSGSFVAQNNVSESKVIKVQMKSIDDIARELGHTKIDVLKMDIEGAEYDLLDSILQSPLRIDQILIEFHDRFFPDGTDRTRRALERLRKEGYQLCAVSDSMEELSFINKKLLS